MQECEDDREFVAVAWPIDHHFGRVLGVLVWFGPAEVAYFDHPGGWKAQMAAGVGDAVNVGRFEWWTRRQGCALCQRLAKVVEEEGSCRGGRDLAVAFYDVRESEGGGDQESPEFRGRVLVELTVRAFG